ncbi:hypothetical protein DFR29_10216 [Tahibacter aquaticus]|uniref:Uncharacterized protein n=1 Tax=Tahibacter aquaticus TaxID=520092 RepID=A0A4R6Z6H9_9GAMM|nr:hypothetical protein [Tahibacter aquaticus]TDR47357.1 hypothetical protein DFR29_10216 [Tahibacter aquaticus]
MLVSYMTLSLQDGDVEVRTGATNPANVLAGTPPCSLTVILREPEVVELRMRFFSMDFVGDQLLPTAHHDESELVGAWLRVMTVALQAADNLDELPLSPGELVEDWWFRAAEGTYWSRKSHQEAITALRSQKTNPGDSLIIIRGERDEVEHLLAAVNRDGREEVFERPLE